jgi:hypothetical protein
MHCPGEPATGLTHFDPDGGKYEQEHKSSSKTPVCARAMRTSANATTTVRRRKVTIRASSSKRLLSLLESIAELVVVRGAGHNTLALNSSVHDGLY